MELPKYISPHEREFPQYVHTLRTFNEIFQGRMREVLAGSVSGWDELQCAVLATGSDGRFEKGPVSGLEFVVLKKATSPPDGVANLINTLHDFAPELVEENVEIKDLDQDSMNRYKNDPLRVFPMRISDLSLLAGDGSLYKEAIEKLISEWKGKGGKSIIDRVKRKKKEYEIVTTTGVQQYNQETQLQHFNYDQGVAYYDPEHKLWSFKIGPLRYVQFALMQDIIAFYRAHQDDTRKVDIIRTLPANTEDRILWLEGNDLVRLSSTDTKELINCYNYFLWMYNVSQYDFKWENRIRVEFNAKQAAERARTLVRIVNQGIIRREPDSTPPRSEPNPS